MSLEITDREDFKDKFTALMVADISLMHAGIDPRDDLISNMIDSFLNQFTVATPAPATRYSSGFIVVAKMTGCIPSHFKGFLYDEHGAAYKALVSWHNSHGRGQISAYEVREVFYFG